MPVMGTMHAASNFARNAIKLFDLNSLNSCLQEPISHFADGKNYDKVTKFLEVLSIALHEKLPTLGDTEVPYLRDLKVYMDMLLNLRILQRPGSGWLDIIDHLWEMLPLFYHGGSTLYAKLSKLIQAKLSGS